MGQTVPMIHQAMQNVVTDKQNFTSILDLHLPGRCIKSLTSIDQQRKTWCFTKTDCGK